MNKRSRKFVGLLLKLIAAFMAVCGVIFLALILYGLSLMGSVV